jgi:predicted nucleic-acid-binding protein
VKLEDQELAVFYNLLLHPFRKLLGQTDMNAKPIEETENNDLEVLEENTNTNIDDENTNATEMANISEQNTNMNDENTNTSEATHDIDENEIVSTKYISRALIISFLRNLKEVLNQLYQKSALYIPNVLLVLIRLLQKTINDNDHQVRSVLVRTIHTVLDLFSEIPQIRGLVDTFLRVISPLIEVLSKQYNMQRSALMDCLEIISKRSEFIEAFSTHTTILPRLLEMLSCAISEPVALQVFQILDSLLEYQLQKKIVIFKNENVAFLLSHFQDLEKQIGGWVNSGCVCFLCLCT